MGDVTFELALIGLHSIMDVCSLFPREPYHFANAFANLAMQPRGPEKMVLLENFYLQPNPFGLKHWQNVHSACTTCFPVTAKALPTAG